LWKKQYEQALAETERVPALNLPFGGLYAWLANTLNYLGRLEEASKLVEKALRLSPRLPGSFFRPLGHTYYLE